MKKSTNKQIAFAILLMFLFYPLGLLLLIFWIKWGGFEKMITALAVLGLGIILWGIFASGLLVALNPIQKLNDARIDSCRQECSGSSDSKCMTKCMDKFEPIPTSINGNVNNY